MASRCPGAFSRAHAGPSRRYLSFPPPVRSSLHLASRPFHATVRENIQNHDWAAERRFGGCTARRHLTVPHWPTLSLSVLLRPGDIQESPRHHLCDELEHNRLSTPYCHWVCVSRPIAQRDFGLASQLLAHTINNIPEQLEVTVTGVPSDVGVGFITPEQRMDGLPSRPRIDFTQIDEFLQESLKMYHHR